ncbi:uncharacterized protein FOMMEDRAFT_157681 [Fomitiporia mediterranea MF3/22]|uniref:uncharacterized protein n=1 Tax=Fomitiporia mediterranea (strain MF3/22) TaxID=694068 RepID=UPI00044092FC|nr:uncharacterized protein FOMMEDRAFT_157681 [Fomitiporia mediterranea MF3/22]EJD02468.1 hypothetical protein FOMMEDRAFT_157681 [Fomitiporia mediterranea MF3/22]
MALQQLRHTSASINEGRFIHLEAIDVEVTGTRPYAKLQIILEGDLQFRYRSDVVEDSLLMHWDCDIEMTVNLGQESVVTIKLFIGEQKSSLDVARLLAPRTIAALGTKVTMLDRLDKISKICDLVNPYAKSAMSVVNTVFEVRG